MKKQIIFLIFVILLTSFVFAVTIDTETANINQDMEYIGANTEAIITLENKVEHNKYKLCFEFPIETTNINLKYISKKNSLWWDEDLKETIKENNRICIKEFTNNNNAEIKYSMEYKGEGIIKYNVTLIPQGKNKKNQYEPNVTLDPYLIGSMQTSNNLLLYLPFDNNINVNYSSLPSILSSSNIRYYYTASNPVAYGDCGDTGLWIDNNWATETAGASCSLSIDYLKTTTDTGMVLQEKHAMPTGLWGYSGCTDTGTYNRSIPQECFNAQTGQVGLLLSTYGGGTFGLSFSCFNGFDYQKIYECNGAAPNAGYPTIYEVAVWITNQSTTTLYSTALPKTEYFNSLNLNWSNSFYFWGNDSVNGLKNDVATTQTATNNNVTFTNDGVYFNGTNSYMNISYYNEFWEGKTEQTMCIDVKLGTNSAFATGRFIIGSLYGKSDYIAYDSNYWIYSSIGNLTAACAVSSLRALNDNQYHKICVTRNTSQCNFYVDGTLTNSGVTSGLMNTTGDLFQIGYNTQAAATWQGNFSLRDVKIYNRSLTYDEVIRINNSGNFSTNIIGENKSALYLNGNEYIAINNNSLSASTSFSICNFAKTISQVSHPVYFDFNSPYGQYQEDGVILQGTLAFGSGFINNEWHHSCFTQDGTTVKSYVDGIYKASSTSGVNFLPTYPLLIGKYRILNTLNLNGYLDEFFVYNYALSQSEVSQLYNGYNASINIYIYDQSTGSLILEPTNIKILNDFVEYEFNNVIENIFINSVPSGNYSITATNNNYQPLFYSTQILPISNQNLRLYMISDNESLTIFTIKDHDTGTIIPNVLMTMEKNINSTWQIVQSKYSDITGKIPFSYLENTQYRFNLSNLAYYDYSFILNPILFTTYEIPITKKALQNYSPDFQDVNINFNPTSFVNGTNTTFSMTFSSPNGVLSAYGYTITYPSSSTSQSGTNDIGETLTSTIPIAATTTSDSIIIDYYYQTSFGRNNYTAIFPITMNTTQTNYTTLTDVKDNTFGMTIFERVLIVSIVAIIFAGILSLFGLITEGLALGLFVYAFFSIIQFIPLWICIPSGFLGILFLMWRASG